MTVATIVSSADGLWWMVLLTHILGRRLRILSTLRPHVELTLRPYLVSHLLLICSAIIQNFLGVRDLLQRLCSGHLLRITRYLHRILFFPIDWKFGVILPDICLIWWNEDVEWTIAIFDPVIKSRDQDLIVNLLAKIKQGLWRVLHCDRAVILVVLQARLSVSSNCLVRSGLIVKEVLFFSSESALSLLGFFLAHAVASFRD